MKAGRSSRFYRGCIAEILVYDRPLATIETLRVEEYLAEKYGLKREYAPPTRGLTLWLDAGSGRGQCRLHDRESSGPKWNGASCRANVRETAGRNSCRRVLIVAPRWTSAIQMLSLTSQAGSLRQTAPSSPPCVQNRIAALRSCRRCRLSIRSGCVMGLDSPGCSPNCWCIAGALYLLGALVILIHPRIRRLEREIPDARGTI